METDNTYRGIFDTGIRHISIRWSALQHVRFCINIRRRRVHYTNPLVYSALAVCSRCQYIILSLNKETDLAAVSGLD